MYSNAPVKNIIKATLNKPNEKINLIVSTNTGNNKKPNKIHLITTTNTENNKFNQSDLKSSFQHHHNQLLNFHTHTQKNTSNNNNNYSSSIKAINDVKSIPTNSIVHSHSKVIQNNITLQNDSIVNKLLELSKDNKLSTLQKAKLFRNHVKDIFNVKGIKDYVWHIVIKSILDNLGKILTSVAVGCVGAFVFSQLLTICGYSSGFNISTLVNESVFLYGSWLASCIYSATKVNIQTMLLSGSIVKILSWIRKSNILGPMLNSNLLSNRYIQRAFERLNVPENLRRATLQNCIELAMIQLFYFSKSTTWSTYFLGVGFTFGLHGAMKGVSLGIQGVSKVPENTIKYTSKGYKATKHMVESIIGSISEMPDQITVLMKNNNKLNVQSLSSKWIKDKSNDYTLDSSEINKELIPLVEQDIEFPEIQSLVGSVEDDILTTITGNMIHTIEEQDKKEPLDNEIIAKMTEELPMQVETEKLINNAWLNYTKIIKVVYMSGALLIVLLSSRYSTTTNSGIMIESIKSLIPKSFHSIIPYMLNLTLKVTPDMIIYNLLKTTGIENWLKHFVNKLPIEKIELVRKLDKQLSDQALKSSSDRNTWASSIINTLIGNKVYTQSQLKTMKKSALLQILKDINGDTPVSNQTTEIQIRELIIKIQEQNIRDFHKSLIKGLVAGIGATLLTDIATSSATSVWTNYNYRTLAVVSNPFLSSQAKLDAFERKALTALLSSDVSNDKLGLSVIGGKHEAAENYAQVDNPGLEIANSGMKKMNDFFGVVAVGNIQIVDRSEVKLTIANEAGYNSWEEYKKFINQSFVNSLETVDSQPTFNSNINPITQKQTLEDFQVRRQQRNAQQLMDNYASLEKDLLETVGKNYNLKETGILDFMDPILKELRGEALMITTVNDQLNTQSLFHQFTQIYGQQQSEALGYSIRPDIEYLPNEIIQATNFMFTPIVLDSLDQYFRLAERSLLGDSLLSPILASMDMLSRTANTGLTLATIQRALIRSHSATKDSRLASWIPAITNFRFPRFDKFVSSFYENSTIQNIIKSSEFNLAEALGGIYKRYIFNEITKLQMIGEIAVLFTNGKIHGQTDNAADLLTTTILDNSLVSQVTQLLEKLGIY